jgi:putative ABC transport system permease protein
MDLNEALKEGGRSSTQGGGRNRVRSALIVSEVALSLVLLVCAGLLGQSFVRLLNVSPGFDPKGLLTMDLVFIDKKYTEETRKVVTLDGILQHAAALPGVRAAAAVDPLPLNGNFISYSFNIEGRPRFDPSNAPSADRRVITPDYFRAMSIPLIKGRAFNERDSKDAPLAVIVNERFAREFFPGEETIGQRLLLDDQPDAPAREIVGVVGDVRHAGLDAETTPELYLPFGQAQWVRMTLVARTTGTDAAGMFASLRGTIRQIDKDIPVYNIRPIEQLLSASVARRRFNMILLGTFALLALMLAAIGIYGVMSYSVTQRTHEIGVRVALGAQSSDVLKLIVRQGMRLVLVGVLVGLAASFALTRIMSSLLFGISPTDLFTFASVSVLLVGIALLACLIPARRATRVDPMVALRYE